MTTTPKMFYLKPPCDPHQWEGRSTKEMWAGELATVDRVVCLKCGFVWFEAKWYPLEDAATDVSQDS